MYVKQIIKVNLLFIFVFFLVQSTGVSKDFPACYYLEEGLKHYKQGNFEQAVFNEHKAIKLFIKGGEEEKHVKALINLSQAYQSLGQYKKALSSLNEAMLLSEKVEDKKYKVDVLNNLGSIYISTGQYDKAEEHLQEGLALAKEYNENDGTVPGIFNNIGNLQMALENYSEAIDIYEEGISLAKKLNNIQLLARISANCAKAYLLDNNYNKASEYLNLSLKKHFELDNSHSKAFGLINIGQAYYDLSIVDTANKDDYKLSAYKAFNAALSVTGAIDDKRVASYALGYIGKLYEDENLHEDALHFTRRAVFASQQIDSPESLYLWQWQTGRLLKAQGKIDDAIMAYSSAVYTLQSVRQGVTESCADCRNVSFSESIEPVYFGLADLLLQKAATLKRHEDSVSYLVKARETIELLKTAELRDYFQDPCVDAYQAKTTNLDTVSGNSAVIYVISLSGRLEILLSSSSIMKRFSVKVSSEVFAQEVRLFRKMLEKRSTRQFMVQAQKLYDWLIGPIEEELVSHKIDTLIFVPDKSLRIVPMAALHDGNRYLIMKYALVITQGLSLIDPKPIMREGLDVLLTGLTESVQGFPALVNVAGEIEDIHGLYGGSILKDREFIIPNIKKELVDTQYSVVHIASHGEFSGDAGKTFLLTWNERLSMDRLTQLIKLSRFRKKPVELLALSACQTASGDDRAALGLAGVAIKAGARSALATLWYVSDEASSRLVVEFYSQLKNKSISKAKALQRAQIELLSDHRYKHPCYWSPFLLIGNWL